MRGVGWKDTTMIFHDEAEKAARAVSDDLRVFATEDRLLFDRLDSDGNPTAQRVGFLFYGHPLLFDQSESLPVHGAEFDAGGGVYGFTMRMDQPWLGQLQNAAARFQALRNSTQATHLLVDHAPEPVQKRWAPWPTILKVVAAALMLGLIVWTAASQLMWPASHFHPAAVEQGPGWHIETFYLDLQGRSYQCTERVGSIVCLPYHIEGNH